MATQEETQNGTSLIFVDIEKHPDARPLDMEMPRLARFFNVQSDKNELVIVIQALAISKRLYRRISILEWRKRQRTVQ